MRYNLVTLDAFAIKMMNHIGLLDANLASMS